MKISHRNFMASQAFYGLAIAGRIPSMKRMKKLVKASYQVADMQIVESRRTGRKLRTLHSKLST